MILILEERNDFGPSNIEVRLTVKSIEDASIQFMSNQKDNYFGSRDYQYSETGNVFVNNKLIAKVSYNGKVWKQNKVVFNPYS